MKDDDEEEKWFGNCMGFSEQMRCGGNLFTCIHLNRMDVDVNVNRDEFVCMYVQNKQMPPKH